VSTASLLELRSRTDALAPIAFVPLADAGLSGGIASGPDVTELDPLTRDHAVTSGTGGVFCGAAVRLSSRTRPFAGESGLRGPERGFGSDDVDGESIESAMPMSAAAMAGTANIAAPTPRTTARVPTRPMYAPQPAVSGVGRTATEDLRGSGDWPPTGSHRDVEAMSRVLLTLAQSRHCR
jgi:hypothetical protein